MPLKIIVTNRKALSAKYGRKLRTVDRAIARLTAADKKRGLQTILLDISSAMQMKKVDARKVTSARNARQAKAAIDAIFAVHQPDYLMILGAPDVVPHQKLTNPVKDDDKDVMSDLPYACEAPYSRRIRDFKAPTRVVGRLPDLAGSTEPSYLVTLLGVAAKWKGRPRRSFATPFAISAEVWKRSTRLSLKRLLGDRSNLNLSPFDGPLWPGPLMGRRLHFINCHGDTNDFQFYGDPEIDDGPDLPVAHVATHLAKRIAEGTVVAAECCYGTQLWDVANAPSAGVHGICSTYLAHKAYGFFGSTTVSYGVDVGNEDADLICRFFFESLLAGASLGRAALEARQRYVKTARRLDQSDLKTLGQFLLLGDPSIHPVSTRATAVAGRAKRKAKARPAAAKRPGFTGAAARRAGLAVEGVRAAAQTCAAARRVSAPTLEATAARLAREAGLTGIRVATNAVEQTPAVRVPRRAPPAVSAARAMVSEVEVKEAPTRVTVVVGTPARPRRRAAGQANRKPAFRRSVAMVLEKVGGTVEVVKVLHRK
jgi:hypothetical protein